MYVSAASCCDACVNSYRRNSSSAVLRRKCLLPEANALCPSARDGHAHQHRLLAGRVSGGSGATDQNAGFGIIFWFRSFPFIKVLTATSR